MTDNEYQKLMSDTKTMLPCLWCEYSVPRCDMPRVGVCKHCFVSERKKNPDTFKNYDRWREFFEKNETKLLTS